MQRRHWQHPMWREKGNRTTTCNAKVTTMTHAVRRLRLQCAASTATAAPCHAARRPQQRPHLPHHDHDTHSMKTGNPTHCTCNRDAHGAKTSNLTHRTYDRNTCATSTATEAPRHAARRTQWRPHTPHPQPQHTGCKDHNHNTCGTTKQAWDCTSGPRKRLLSLLWRPWFSLHK